MCLKVFTKGDEKLYSRLSPGARHLGSAFQKVNFLRDFADDSKELGRIYFPNIKDENLTNSNKADIVSDLKIEFALAEPYITALPADSRIPVAISLAYYKALLQKLDRASTDDIMNNRIRINNFQKILIMIKTIFVYTFKPRPRLVK